VTGELLTFDVDDSGAEVVVKLTGEMDFGTAPSFLDTTQPLVAPGRNLILDLADLGFCDSSGLGAFVRLHKAAGQAGGALCLSRVRPQLMATIRMTRLDRLLTIRDELPQGPATPA
jgi:anti-sigma B factor antagonist